MYKVKLYPSNCPIELSWIREHRDGEIHNLSEYQYRIHEKHGCMLPIEKYRIVTTSKTLCGKCGQMIIKRKKVILHKFR